MSLEFKPAWLFVPGDRPDRYTKAARLGLVVLRFSWMDVMFRPDDVRAAIEDVVRWRTMQAVGRHGLVA